MAYLVQCMEVEAVYGGGKGKIIYIGAGTLVVNWKLFNYGWTD